MIPFIHVEDVIFRLDEVSDVVRLFSTHAGEDGKVETMTLTITRIHGEPIVILNDVNARKAWDIMIEACNDWRQQNGRTRNDQG